MKGTVYLLGFAAMVLSGLLIGRYVENFALAFLLAAFGGMGLMGLTEQIAQTVDDGDDK